MPNLSNIGVIKDILSRHGFTFSKALGQNFLVNPSVCPRMAEMSGAKKGVGVLEIGPGIGVLTKELALRADKVVCIEIDKRLPDILAETLSEFENVKIINEDVLKLDLHKVVQEEFGDKEVVVCANLPYYITSPIIMSVLEAGLPIRSLTVMVQKEVAQRICKRPPDRNVSPLSYAVWYYAEPSMLFSVSRGSFMPAPDVDSAVIRLDIRPLPAVEVQEPDGFFRLIQAAFSQRRKTLCNALSAGLALPKEEVASVLTASNIPATARAEQLSLEDFAHLYDKIRLC